MPPLIKGLTICPTELAWFLKQHATRVDPSYRAGFCLLHVWSQIECPLAPFNTSLKVVQPRSPSQTINKEWHNWSWAQNCIQLDLVWCQVPERCGIVYLEWYARTRLVAEWRPTDHRTRDSNWSSPVICPLLNQLSIYKSPMFTVADTGILWRQRICPILTALNSASCNGAKRWRYCYKSHYCSISRHDLILGKTPREANGLYVQLHHKRYINIRKKKVRFILSYFSSIE